MPAHFPVTSEQKEYQRSVLADLADSVTTLSHLRYVDLVTVCEAMRILRVRTFAGRTYASFRSELRYRARTYFAREQRLRVDDMTIGFDAERFGISGNDPDFNGVVNPYGLRFVLASLDSTYMLVYDMPIMTEAYGGKNAVTVTAVTPTVIFAPHLPVPVLVHHRGNSADLPEYGIDRFDSRPDMVVRELPKMARFVNRLYQGGGHGGIWAALERIWCELLQTQRPLVRPLSRVSVEARIRSLEGLTVRITHTGGICIGRCPDVGRFVGRRTLTVTTSNRDEEIPIGSIREIGPWNGSYGRKLLLTTT